MELVVLILLLHRLTVKARALMHNYIDSCLFLNHTSCVYVLMVLRVLTEENTGVSCIIATSHRYSAFRLLLQTHEFGCLEPSGVQEEPQQALWSFSEFSLFYFGSQKLSNHFAKTIPHFFTDTHQQCGINMRLLAYIPSNGYIVAVGHKAPYRDIHGGGIAPYAHSQCRTTRS
jgi:hypothetical protein